MSLLAPPFDGDALQGQDIVAIIVDAFLVVLDSDAVNVDEACLNCMGALRAIAEDEDRKRELIDGDGKEVLEKVLSRAVRDQELSTAALEVLAVLSDTFQQDLQHSAQFAHGLYYNELEKLCTKHGYTQEVAL